MRRLLLVLPALALLASCAGPTQLGFSQQQWQSMTPQQRQQLAQQYHSLSAYKPATVYAGPNIQVSLANGKAAMPPFAEKYSFAATNFSIKPGSCKHIQLSSMNSNNFTEMRVCYDGLHLSLDPSKYDPTKVMGTAHFAYNPLWLSGFTYADVSTSGYVNLEGASITIKALNNPQ